MKKMFLHISICLCALTSYSNLLHAEEEGYNHNKEAARILGAASNLDKNVNNIENGLETARNILGIKEGDNPKKAYFALAKKWHPDKYKAEDGKYIFKLITNAKNVLNNDKDALQQLHNLIDQSQQQAHTQTPNLTSLLSDWEKLLEDQKDTLTRNDFKILKRIGSDIQKFVTSLPNKDDSDAMHNKVEFLITDINIGIKALIKNMKSRTQAYFHLKKRTSRFNSIKLLANSLNNQFIPSVKAYIQSSHVDQDQKDKSIEKLDQQVSSYINNELITEIDDYLASK